MKGQPTEWEKIFANNATNSRLISKTYKQLIQLNNKKTTNQPKHRQNTYIDISPKKIYRWPTGIRKDAHMLVITETQIKTTVRYHLIPVRMAIIKKSINNKY